MLNVKAQVQVDVDVECGGGANYRFGNSNLVVAKR